MNWTSILEDLSPDEMTNLFLKTLLEKISLVFKKRNEYDDSEDEQKRKGQFSSGNKIPRKIRIWMRNKSKLSKCIQRTKSPARYLKLLERMETIEKHLKDSYDERRNKQEHEALAKMKKDPKFFFKYAKKFSKSTSDIGPFLNQEGDVVTDGVTITEMLKEQYNSVFSSPREDKKVSSPVEFFSINTANEQLDNIVFDKEDVIDAIDKLNKSSSCGPDGVPAIFLKMCKRSLSEPLEILFRCYLLTGIIPAILKEAFVIPIHKAGPRSNPANFRPVSLTSHIIKTMERIVRKTLVNHLEINQKLNLSHHGFRNRRSCLSQLLEHYDKVLRWKQC